MFKRIAKIVGFVLLGFVLLIGGVVGFMAIRGDFKKKVVKPTAINFSIEKTDLVFNVDIQGEPTLGNGRVNSFTIKAEPLDINVTECTLKLSAPLITFVKWENGGWVKNNSSTFHLNTPIYFVVNNVVDDVEGKKYAISEEDYYDGVLTITVKDASGLLQDTLDLVIDRSITSISFKDRALNSKNNIITDGLFGYEDEYGGVDNQVLEVIEGQDYPLEVLTAPLKASKPFNGEYPEGDPRNAEKIYEIYYVKEGQPNLLTHYDEVVKLQRYNDQTTVEEDCNFLKYDTVNGCYVFNSNQSGEFEFKLATYPTYAIQQEILSKGLSFVDRLNFGNDNSESSVKMLKKTVVIKVSGTDAQKIEFKGDDSFDLQLLKDNKWVVNNPTIIDKDDLGLILSKENSPEILSRYNELKFFTSEDTLTDFNWEFKEAVLTAEGVQSYKNSNIEIKFQNNLLGKREATISGIDGISASIEFSVTLKFDNNYYVLELINTQYHNDEKTQYTKTSVKFYLNADKITGKVLSLNEGEYKWTEDDEIISKLTKVDISQSNEEGLIGNTSKSLYLDLQVDKCFILGDKDESTESYAFKTLKSGMYLVLVGKGKDKDETTKSSLINDKFVTSIDYNAENTIITIKPIDSGLDKQDIQLYAIVVNSDGGCKYTIVPRDVVVSEVPSQITLNNSDLSLPVIVGEELDYGSGFDVEELVTVQQGGSYSSVLIFAPRYSPLTQVKQPAEWGKGLVVYDKDGNIVSISKDTKYEPNKYYVKNNFKNFDGYVDSKNDNTSPMVISVNNGNEIYYLIGYFEDGKFVNKVVPIGNNTYSKLYPVVIKTEYLTGLDKLQSAEDYINKLVIGQTGDSSAQNIGDIEYDLSLLNNSKVTVKNGNAYIQVTGDFDSSKTYYNENGEEVEVNPEDTDALYYEKVNVENAKDILGEVSTQNYSRLNEYLTYYKLEDGKLINPTRVTKETRQTIIDSWDSWYIVVSHYLINEVEYNSNNINIKTYACSEGRKLTENVKTFTISRDDYKIATEGAFNIDVSKIYQNQIISANSYYDFANSTVKPTGAFGGTYFDGTDFNHGDYCEVVAEHGDIEFDWNGDNSNLNNWISNKTLHTSLYLQNINDAQILQEIVSKLSVSAIEYDANGNIYSLLQNNIELSEEIHYGYVVAGSEYDAKRVYYTKSGDTYQKADITTEIKDAWSTQHTNYYVYEIYNEVEVTGVINKGHYFRFVWTYTNGSLEYKVYSPQLKVLSRDVTGYQINVGHTLYKASLIKTDTTEDIYEIQDSKFVKVETFNSENKQYILTNVEYTDEPYYLLEIGYNEGYTYVVYAVDKDGNYLYYKQGDATSEEYKIAKVGASIALNLNRKVGGGWIKSNPLYAKDPEFEINDSAYIDFEYDSTNKINSIAFAQVNSGFEQVTLGNGTVSKTINIKVVQDGKFISGFDGITKISNTKEISLSNLYKYDDDDDISNELLVDITNFSIEKTEDISDDYKTKVITPKKHIQIVKIDNEDNCIVELKFDNNKWLITRTAFDTIKLTVNFKSVLGNNPVEFEFTSPYKNVSKTSNATTEIYAGTKFVLGTTEDTGALYKLGIEGTDGHIKITYSYNDKTGNIIGSADGWVFDVPLVDKDTKCEFKIWYVDNNAKEGEPDTFVDAFSLTIKPNVKLITDVSEVIKLDDLTNNTYNFIEGDNKLEIKEYATTNNYPTYSNEGLQEIATTDFVYNVYTYTDSEFSSQYATNVAKVENGKLSVISPISQVGTYYVKVLISLPIYEGEDDNKTFIGNALFAEMKFEITTKTEVVNNANPLNEVIAMKEQSYNLTQLNNMFALSRDDKTTYELTDILWIHNTNPSLIIKYTYANATLEQTCNNLKYNDKNYVLYGTSYNMGSYKFDIDNNKFINGDTELTALNCGNNVWYYSDNGKLTLYCKQNAYIFVNANDDTNIIVISIETNGKTIYEFNNTALAQPTKLYELETLSLKYNSFGIDLSTNATIVDSIEYSVELVFNTKYNIKTNNIYNINIQPYTVEPKTEVVLSGNTYTLRGELFNTSGYAQVETIAFGTSDDYKKSTGTDGVETINFYAKGNSYITYIPVTITYKNNGGTYSYNVPITVINSTKVNINYPYNVDDKSNEATYNTFNASISEFTKSVENLYDANDFAKWLGFDTSITTWKEDSRVKYDLALKGDKIDLATSETLRNVVRYNVWTFENVDTTQDTYAPNTYYEYNVSTKSLELVTDKSVEDWNNLTYFKRVGDTTTSISKIELVAVSSTYVNNLQNIVDNIALNGTTISISTSLNYTGYVLFKVYAGDTSAYGYYVLKIVDDELFENAISIGENNRRTQTIANKISFTEVTDKQKYPYEPNKYYDKDGNLLTTETAETYYRGNRIIDFIRNSGYDIGSVSAIPYDLINADNSNVYLFKINSNAEGDIDSVDNYKLISNDTLLQPSAKSQTITVAVVVQSGTSLVHVCNYNIVIKVDVGINLNIPDGDENLDNDAENDLITVLDANKYEYSMELEYSYNNGKGNVDGNKNGYDFSKPIINGGYLTISGNTYGGQPTSIAFDSNKSKSDGVGYDEDNYQITFKDNGTPKPIATITGTQLILNCPVSEEIFFYLTLTNGKGFEISLRIILNPFVPKSDTNATVGLWNGEKFDNNLNLATHVFGTYEGNYNYVIKDANTGAVVQGQKSEDITANTDTNKKVEIPTDTEERSYIVEVTLTSVVPSITKPITVKAMPHIHHEYTDASKQGENAGNRLTPNKTITTTGQDLTTAGNKLYVDKNTNNTTNITTITVQDKKENPTKQYLTIKVDNFSSVYFSFADVEDCYFVDSNNLASKDIVLSQPSELSFVHSAKDIDLKLNVQICNYSGEYYAAVKSSKDYEPNKYFNLSGQMITTDIPSGAYYEMVKVDNGNKSTYPFKPNTYYTKNGDDSYTLIDGAYDATYPLYITLPKTYSLEATYRVTGGQYETVVDGSELDLSPRYYQYDNANTYTLTTNIKPNEYNVDNWYTLEVVKLTQASYVGEFYSLENNGNYTKASSYSENTYYKLEPSKVDISNNFFGSDSNDDEISGTMKDQTIKVNKSRIAIAIDINDGDTIKTEYYYGFDNINTLGLLSDNNPNKLTYDLNSNINDGVLTFNTDILNSEYNLVLTNSTTKVEYTFKIMSEERYYGRVEYNNNLLQTEDDTIVIPYRSFIDAEGNVVGIDIAYLQYSPNLEDGLIGVAVFDKTLVTGQFVTEQTTDYTSKLVIKVNSQPTTTTTVKLTIITVNGATKPINLVISNVVLSYGYGDGYETAYAGTQIGKLNDAYNGEQRVTLTVNASTTNEDGETYTIDYKGAVNGNVSHWYYDISPDYSADDRSLIWYTKSNDNSLNGVISSRSVARNTFVTMMFDVKDSKGIVVDRIYYVIMLQNNIKIGMNPMLDNQYAIDLYLGSEIYKVEYREITSQDQLDELEDINISVYTKETDYGNVTYNIDTSKDKTYSDGKYYYAETIIDLLQSEEYKLITSQDELDKAKTVYIYDSTKTTYTKLSTKPTTYTADTHYVRNDNNIFVTLEQYSTNNLISENDSTSELYDGPTKALYNGSKSTLDITPTGRMVKNYLRFTVDKGDLTGKVRVDENAKLYIAGNPSGAFVLNIFSTNGTGYGEQYTINVHQFDNTTAQYSNQINRNSGTGFESGTKVPLFKNNGNLTGDDAKVGDYAFVTNRLGYSITELVTSSIFQEGVEISYQVLTFEHDTSINEIKQSTEWDKLDESIPVTDDIDIIDEYPLPSVKYSSDDNGESQIVTIRLAIRYNGETNYYFAHYLVYNKVQLVVNSHYQENKTIKYGEYAWQEGETITIMGTDGMYQYNADSDIVKSAEGDGSITKYEAYIKVGDKKPRIITDLKHVNNRVTGTLPYYGREVDGVEETEHLFDNDADIVFILKATDGGATLLEDNWTMQAGTPITPNQTKLLSDFFLTSEIGNQKYYNIPIIGIGESYDNFVTGGKWTDVDDVTDISLPNGYSLKRVTYEGGDENCKVFKVVRDDCYVLVGHDKAMSFNFNGGDYYINVTIDDGELTKDGELTPSATINIADFVTVWYYTDKDGRYFDYYDNDTVSIIIEGQDDASISLDNIDKQPSNISKDITVKCGDISRDIQVYFNIIINAKNLDSNGDGTNDGIMPCSERLVNAMADSDGVLTIEEINDNIELKKELLSLIKFNGQNVATDNTTLTYYSIEVKSVENENYYNVVYTYNNGVSTYTRTLKISNVKSN